MQGSLAVISQTGESLTFLDIASGARTGHLANLTAEPHELCFDEKRNLLYISHTYRHGHFWVHGDYAHEISVIDCASKTCVEIIDVAPAQGPHGLYMDKQRDIVYASVEALEEGQPGGIIGIDLTTRKVSKRIESASKPHWFVMTPDGRKAYTCNKTQSFISVVDLQEGTLLGIIDVHSTEEPSMSPDGQFAYFPTPGFTFGVNPPDASLRVIDTATDKIVKSVPTGHGVQSTHVTSQNTIMVAKYSFTPESTAAAPKPEGACLALYDGKMHELRGEVRTGHSLTIRSSADGKLGFTANIFNGTVSVVDLDTMTVVKTLEADMTPNPTKQRHLGAHGLAIMP